VSMIFDAILRSPVVSIGGLISSRRCAGSGAGGRRLPGGALAAFHRRRLERKACFMPSDVPPRFLSRHQGEPKRRRGHRPEAPRTWRDRCGVLTIPFAGVEGGCQKRVAPVRGTLGGPDAGMHHVRARSHNRCARWKTRRPRLRRPSLASPGHAARQHPA